MPLVGKLLDCQESQKHRTEKRICLHKLFMFVRSVTICRFRPVVALFVLWQDILIKISASYCGMNGENLCFIPFLLQSFEGNHHREILWIKLPKLANEPFMDKNLFKKGGRTHE